MGKRKEKIKETNPHNTVRARANSIHILKNNENRTENENKIHKKRNTRMASRNKSNWLI